MDPLDKLRESFSIEELRAEKAKLDSEISARARRVNRIDTLIALLQDLSHEQTASNSGELDDTEPAEAEAERPSQRPSLDDGILQVMGEWDPITIWTGEKILIQLRRRDWAPRGQNPRNTVDATLSRLTKQGRLERIGRGVYKLPSETSDGVGATEASVAETLDVDGA